jgi:hypothetical protein
MYTHIQSWPLTFLTWYRHFYKKWRGSDMFSVLTWKWCWKHNRMIMKIVSESLVPSYDEISHALWPSELKMFEWNNDLPVNVHIVYVLRVSSNPVFVAKYCQFKMKDQYCTHVGNKHHIIILICFQHHLHVKTENISLPRTFTGRSLFHSNILSSLGQSACEISS